MAKTAGQMGYHIFHYKERFGFEASGHSDRFTKGPPKFVKYYIGKGDDDETISLDKQKCALKAYKLYDTLNTAFIELLALAAYQSAEYRGWLLDGSQRGADIVTIAGLIGRDVKIVKQVMEILLKVGLIEYGPLPKFKQIKHCPSDAGRQPASARHRTGKDRKSLNNKGKRKRISRTRKSKQEIKGFKAEFEKWKAATKSQAAQQSQDPTQNKTSSPKTHSTGSEVPGGKAQEFYTKISDIPLDSVFKTSIDAQAMGFASEVYKLLKMSPSLANIAILTQLEITKMKQELFNYYNAWLNAMNAGLSDTALKALWFDSMKSARRIGEHKERKHKGGYRNLGAGWRSEFNKNLAAFEVAK